MEDSKEYKEGYEEGYKNGREWYVNDIGKEIFNINIAIRVLEKYNEDDEKLIEELQNIKAVLIALQSKVKKEFNTKFN